MRSLDPFGGRGEANQEFAQISHTCRKQYVTYSSVREETFH